MTTSEQLEREAEATRSQLVRSLDELRDRITPGQLVDQLMDYAKDSGGGDFVRNLGRQVRDNPLPVCLVGAGIAWLALANGKGSSGAGTSFSERVSGLARQAGDRLSGRVGDGLRDGLGNRLGAARDQFGNGMDSAQGIGEGMGEERGDRAGGWTSTAGDRIGDYAGAASDAVGSAYDSAKSRAAAAASGIGDTASSAYQSMSDTASRAASTVAGSASRIGQRTAGSTRNLLQFCAEQPLVLAGIGLAIGAALGAALPATETEDRLMGDTSDRLKEQAQDVAEEQLQKGKSAAEQGLQQVQDVAQQGLGSDRHDPAWTTPGPSLAPTEQPGGDAQREQRQETERHGAG